MSGKFQSITDALSFQAKFCFILYSVFISFVNNFLISKGLTVNKLATSANTNGNKYLQTDAQFYVKIIVTLIKKNTLELCTKKRDIITETFFRLFYIFFHIHFQLPLIGRL